MPTLPQATAGKATCGRAAIVPWVDQLAAGATPLAAADGVVLPGKIRIGLFHI